MIGFQIEGLQNSEIEGLQEDEGIEGLQDDDGLLPRSNTATTREMERDPAATPVQGTPGGEGNAVDRGWRTERSENKLRPW